MFSVDTA